MIRKFSNRLLSDIRADQAGLIKGIIIYGVGIGLSRGVYLLLLPFLTRYLSPSEYGILELANTLTALGVGLGLMGIQEGVFRFFFDDDFIEHRRAVVTSGMLFGITALFSVAIMFLLFRKGLALLIFKDPTRTVLVAMLGAKILVDGVRQVGMNLFRMRGRAVTFALLSILFAFVGSGLAIYFLISGRHIAERVYLGMLLSSVLVGTFAIISNKDILERKAFDAHILYKMVIYGAPLALATVFNWVIDISDRLVINGLISTAAVGIYTSGYRIASAVQLVAMAAGTAWPFMALSNMKEESAPRSFGRSFTMFLALFLSITIIVVPNREWLVAVLLGHAFKGASAYILPLALGFVLMGLTFIVETGVSIRKKSWVAMGIRAIAGATNVGLNFALIPRFGPIAAAYTTLATYGFLFISSTIIGARYFPIKFEVKKLSVLVVTFGVSMGCGLLFTGLFWKTGGALLYFVVMGLVFGRDITKLVRNRVFGWR